MEENHIVDLQLEPGELTVRGIEAPIWPYNLNTRPARPVDLYNSALVPGPVPALVWLELQWPHIAWRRLIHRNIWLSDVWPIVLGN